MFAKSVLITGSTQGIGLELVKQLAGKTDILFATHYPGECKELQKVADINTNVVLLELDVTSEESIKRAVNVVEKKVNEDGLNCLFNNAGIIDRTDSFEKTELNVFRKIHETNTMGPVMMIKAFLPLLKKASSACNDDVMSVSRASVLNISSNFGSITWTDNVHETTNNLVYAYRMSKVALNMFSKVLSMEYKNDKILVANFHPGWVRTPMGGPHADIDVTESVSGILSVASRLNEDGSGLVHAWDGSIVPW